ncbi:peptidoglycan binding domain protein [Onchocerca flexuosa]|uniref:Peptidoglycan binding domain protein n=1 Tax=Onchocerca flexuosa TaxID=387005 RepID=A0A238C4X2_9BILA|nr:peptidoglycan binding domain protein [Onchocerca flexuosa]
MQLTILMFLSSILFFTFSDVSMKQAAGIMADISVERATQYLSDYGYLKETISPSPMSVPSTEAILRHYSVTIRDALKKFQKFAGLKPTGKLDVETRKKMQQKRCGRPDVIALQKLGEYKWKKNDLTYSIESLPKEPSEREVRSGQKMKNVHEIGHVLGLEHSSDTDSIMAPFYRDAVDRRGNYITPKLSSSDVKNIQRLYGLNDKKSNPRSTLTEHGSDFETDSSNGDNDSNHDRKTDIGCPDEIDGIITVDGSNYLFSGNKVYDFDHAGIKEEYLLKNLFSNGPPFVQGALSNPRTDRTLLFHGKMVFAYHLDRYKNKFMLEPKFPKKLPAALNFKPMGAFLWHEGSQVLINGNHFATYDENWNQVTLQNEVVNYFDNFPAKPIRGVLIQQMNVLLFGDDKIYKYDIKDKRVIGKAIPLKAFLMC